MTDKMIDLRVSEDAYTILEKMIREDYVCNNCSKQNYQFECDLIKNGNPQICPINELFNGDYQQSAKAERLRFFDEIVEGLRPTSKDDVYPESVFIPPTEEQWGQLREYIEKDMGLTLDKFAAEIGRNCLSSVRFEHDKKAAQMRKELEE